MFASIDRLHSSALMTFETSRDEAADGVCSTSVSARFSYVFAVFSKLLVAAWDSAFSLVRWEADDVWPGLSSF
jgi:hypothetical protein